MVKTSLSIAVLYAVFAVCSAALNILAQMLFVWIYIGPYYIELSILIGTVTSLPLRFFLEKRYIFAFKTKHVLCDGQLFVLYSLTGIVTTLIFWSVEYGFHLVFRTDAMRYIGGVVGLSIGFYVKYQLDKKYVFICNEEEALS